MIAINSRSTTLRAILLPPNISEGNHDDNQSNDRIDRIVAHY